jgi:hypothetical protein
MGRMVRDKPGRKTFTATDPRRILRGLPSSTRHGTAIAVVCCRLVRSWAFQPAA